MDESGDKPRWTPLFSSDLPAPCTWNGDRAKAVEYICDHLAKGLWPMSVICAQLDPRVPKQTLFDWRARDQAVADAIDNAFDRGKDQMAGSMLLIAQGAEGFSTGSVKRDRLFINTAEKLLSKWDKRYRDRLVHENDPDNPMPAPTFVLQPVKSLQEIERPSGKPPTEAEANSDDE